MAREEISRATLTAQLEDAIRAEIVAGRLRPGERLRAVDLSRRYSVSATPAREALQRLAAQGLVSLDPQMGARVAGVSIEEMRDIYMLRLILEPLALVRSIEAGDYQWLEGVRREHKAFMAVSHASRMDVSSPESIGDWARAHRRFHWQLASGCGSPWLMHLLSILYDHSARYALLSTREVTQGSSVGEHDQIVDAALAQDAHSARAGLERHLRNTMALLERRISKDVPASLSIVLDSS